MTELVNDLDAPSDAELISRVRAGDVQAYGELFERHVGAARRLAKQLVRGPDSEDLVSDAFAKVMQVLQGGGGPDIAFRAYLLTAIRRLHVDRVRAQSRLTTTDDMTAFDPGVPFNDTAVANFESGAAAKAFASLPERWQLVLWHLEVEGQKPADIAPLLGMSPNSVSALAYRAREGLRQAFLTQHLADTPDAGCRWVTEHLGAYVREGLSKRDSAKVKDHLDQCRQCTAMYLELTEVNSNLAAIIGPMLLGAAAAGYAAAAGSGIGGAGGISFLIGRARDAVLANTTTAVATGAVAASVAAGVSVGAVVAVQHITADHHSTPEAAGTKKVATAPAEPGATPSVAPQAPAAGPQIAPVDAAVADLSLGSAAIADDAVVLDLEGLPSTPVSVNVDLTSDTGKTTFAVRSGSCTVTADNPSRAVCDPSTGGAGASVLTLAPNAFEAVIPLDWQKGLDEDKLSVKVSIPGFSDPAMTDNTATFTFVPSDASNGKIGTSTVKPAAVTATTAPTTPSAPSEPSAPSAGPTQAAVSVPTTPTSVTTSEISYAFGGTQTLSATIAPAEASGKVTFFAETGMPLCSGTIQNGVVTCVPATVLAPGQHRVVATYMGDSTYMPSSDAFYVTVAKAAPVLSAPDVTATYGDDVTVVTALEGASPASTGTVELREGETLLGTGEIDGGAASIHIPAGLLAGAHALSATYSGDEQNNSATAALSLTVEKAESVVVADDVTGTYGETATLAVVVTGAGVVDGDPISLDLGGTQLSSAVSDGAATFTLPTDLTPGNYTATVSYAGNANALASTASAAVVVSKASASIVAPAVVAHYNAPVVANVSVSGKGVKDGDHVVLSNDDFLSTGSLVSGSAAVDLPDDLDPGDHYFVATYLGNATTKPVATIVTVTVGTAPSHISAPDLTVDEGDQAAVSVKVTGDFTATGTVRLLDGSTELGHATLVNGGATLSAGTLSVGSHTFTVSYGGDDNLAGSTSTVHVTVQAAPSGPPPWDRTKHYKAGDSVSYNGKIWTVVVDKLNPDGWSDVTSEPGTTGDWGAWQDDQVDPATGIRIWTSSWNFVGGDLALYNDKLWQIDPGDKTVQLRATPPDAANESGRWMEIQTNQSDGKATWTPTRIFGYGDPGYATEAWYNGHLYKVRTGQNYLRGSGQRPDTTTWGWQLVQ